MKISQLIKKYGLIKFTFLAVFYSILKFIRERCYTWKKDNFGVKEAVFWSTNINQFLRYSKIVGELKKIEPAAGRKTRLLEVGAGGEGIAQFLKYSGDSGKYDIYLADKNASLLKKVKLGKPIILENSTLPFADNEFDVVISSDTLEHIPKDERPKFINELKRVGKIVLLHFVMHDPPNNFLGRDIDFEFNKWHLKEFKTDEPWTLEHLKVESPTCSEIQSYLPGASTMGTQNINVWFKCQTLSSYPLSGFFTGFSFINKWKQYYNDPPFHGCFVKWDKGMLNS